MLPPKDSSRDPPPASPDSIARAITAGPLHPRHRL